MKTRKRRMEFISFYNHTGLEAHFTKMAKKGWLIESISNYYWTYRKIEPKDIHFCVTYYPRASDFDPEPSPEQQTFHDFCAHTGWQLCCTWHQMQVFYNEKEDPIPLETDPVLEVETLHKACKKNFLPSYYIMLALSFLMSCYFVAGIHFDPIGLLSNSSRLVAEFAFLCMFLISAVELITYFTWHKKSKQEAQNGIFVETPSTSQFQKAIMVFLLIAVAWWFANLFAADDPLLLWVAVMMMVGMLTIIFLVNGIKQWLKKAKASRGMNKFLTLLACFLLPTILTSVIIYAGISLARSDSMNQKLAANDTVPLSVADFMEVEKGQYVITNDQHHTFLLGRMNVDAFPHWDLENRQEFPDLRYNITIVKVPALYDWCKNQMYYDQDETDSNEWPVGNRMVYKEQDASAWGAKEAYRLYSEEGWWTYTYLLCYEDRIIEIRFDWEPTAEQMQIVAQKLNP